MCVAGKGGGRILKTIECIYGNTGFAKSMAVMLEFRLVSLASKGPLSCKLNYTC